MAEGTGNSNLCNVIAADLRLQAEHGIELEQRNSGLRTRQVMARQKVSGKRSSVHFESNSQRDERTHVLLDHLVHTKGIGPERLVAESVEPENLLTLADEPRGCERPTALRRQGDRHEQGAERGDEHGRAT